MNILGSSVVAVVTPCYYQVCRQALVIGTDEIYEFRLYSGAQHEMLLAQLKARWSDRVFITTTSNPVPLSGTRWDITLVSWDTGDGSESEVHPVKDRASVDTSYSTA
jgi:hypothetical protein